MPSAVARLASELTEEKVRALLTELLEANQAPQPAPAVRARRGRKPGKLTAKQRYVAKRSAKRAAAQAEKVAAKAATPAAPATVKAKPKRRVRITRHGGKPRKRPAPAGPNAGNGADEAWRSAAHAAVSAADRLGPAAVRDRS